MFFITNLSLAVFSFYYYICVLPWYSLLLLGSHSLTRFFILFIPSPILFRLRRNSVRKILRCRLRTELWRLFYRRTTRITRIIRDPTTLDRVVGRWRLHRRKWCARHHRSPRTPPYPESCLRRTPERTLIRRRKSTRTSSLTQKTVKVGSSVT